MKAGFQPVRKPHRRQRLSVGNRIRQSSHYAANRNGYVRKPHQRRNGLWMGFGSRDRQHGCEGVHDDIFVRALYLMDEKEEVLIMGFDLCFLGREDADRYKGAIGRKIDFSPRQILLNTSHTHVGPSVGTWGYADYKPSERLYLRELESATVAATCQAKENTREVTLWTGTCKSSLPVNRRRRDEHGNMAMLPNPDGVVCDLLPVCLLKDMDGKPVSLLFSVSCHPSTISGFEISAEYPGHQRKQSFRTP